MVGTHQLLAKHVRFLIQHQTFYYEKQLILCNRHRLTAMTEDQSNILDIVQVLSNFVENHIYNECYVFVHQTLLMFLYDWFVASNLQQSVLEYHQQETGLMHRSCVRCLQRWMSLPGWNNMTIDQKLFLALMVNEDIIDQPVSFVPFLQNRYKRFCLSMGMSDFCNFCNGLREVMITKHDEYLHSFNYVDGMHWNIMRQLTLQELQTPPMAS